MPCQRRLDLGEQKRGQVHLPTRYASSHEVPRSRMLSARHALADSEGMARQPRLDLPGIPQHIVQRGNNRLPCFLDDNDRQRYLTLLREALLDTGCKLHAYVLTDHHVHCSPRRRKLEPLPASCKSSDAATSVSSILVTGVREHWGKAATKPAWLTAKAMSCGATALSNSTPSARE